MCSSDLTFPAAPSFAFLMANTVPEENPAHVHQILVDHKIVAVETLAAGVVDRKLHEQDAIVQPIMARSSGAMKPSFHTGVMANGTPTARRRMAYFLWANILDLVEPFHKRLAHQANRDKITSRISAFLSRLKALGRIESFLPPTAEWSSPQLTVTVVVNETPNADTITIRGTFGADVVQDAEG